MLCFDRRYFLALIGVGATTACGFQPVYRENGTDNRLFGRVLLPEARDPESFAFRERSIRRFGEPGSDTAYRLDFDLAIEEEAAAITQARDTTRYRLIGAARYALINISSGERVAEGVARTNSGYDASAGVFATRSARVDARRRLAVELAELTASRLLAEAALE